MKITTKFKVQNDTRHALSHVQLNYFRTDSESAVSTELVRYEQKSRKSIRGNEHAMHCDRRGQTTAKDEEKAPAIPSRRSQCVMTRRVKEPGADYARRCHAPSTRSINSRDVK